MGIVLAALEVGGLTQLERPVIDEAATAKGTSQVMCLLFGRIEPIEVCSLGHAYLSFWLFLRYSRKAVTISPFRDRSCCFARSRNGSRTSTGMRMESDLIAISLAVSMRPLYYQIRRMSRVCTLKRNGTLIPPHEWRRAFPCRVDNLCQLYACRFSSASASSVSVPTAISGREPSVSNRPL